jgi:hypothetical protein
MGFFIVDKRGVVRYALGYIFEGASSSPIKECGVDSSRGISGSSFAI